MLRVDRADRRRASLLDLREDEDRSIRQKLKLAEDVSVYSLKGFVETCCSQLPGFHFSNKINKTKCELVVFFSR